MLGGAVRRRSRELGDANDPAAGGGARPTGDIGAPAPAVRAQFGFPCAPAVSGRPAADGGRSDCSVDLTGTGLVVSRCESFNLADSADHEATILVSLS